VRDENQPKLSYLNANAAPPPHRPTSLHFRSMPQYDYSTSGFVKKDVARALSKCDDLLTALPRLLLEAGALASPEMLIEAHLVVFKALKPLLKGGPALWPALSNSSQCNSCFQSLPIDA